MRPSASSRSSISCSMSRARAVAFDPNVVIASPAQGCRSSGVPF
jgi:hypothetical protein